MIRVDLSSQVALVTGAGNNIGKAIADALVANGAKVVYADIDLAAAQKAAQASPNGVALHLDVTNDEQVHRELPRIAKELGRLDILVNNAGVNTGKHRVTLDEFPRHEWDRLLAVDLTGLYVVSQAGAKIMRQAKYGRIINISSVLGLVPARLQCAFVAAKAGVVNLTRAMALELAPHGILTNAIAPGSILTEGTKGLFYGPNSQYRDAAEKMLAHIPVGRPGESDDIANAAVFLASRESGYINGHCLVVDGGWLAGYIREF